MFVVQANTADQLRQAQALLLPLELGITLGQTAQAIVVSVGWTCQSCRQIHRQHRNADTDRARPGGQRQENMKREAEAGMLEPSAEKAKSGDARQARAGEMPQSPGRIYAGLSTVSHISPVKVIQKISAEQIVFAQRLAADYLRTDRRRGRSMRDQSDP